MATARPLAPPVELKAHIEMLHEEALRAFNNRDLEKLVSFYAPDAMVMPPNQVPAAGLNAIRELYTEAFEMGFSNFQFEMTRVVPSNELVATSGTYTIDLKTPSDIIHDRGKFVAVYQVMKNGAWKVLFDIWNSDLPPVTMTMK